MNTFSDLDALFSSSPSMLFLFTILMLWSLSWKGVALWKAGGKQHLGWFIFLFLVNTVGILEILYIFVFSEKQKKPEVTVTSQQEPQTENNQNRPFTA